jgi:hypothetical protein
MVDFLSMERDAREKGERFGKILETERFFDRLAVVAGRPAVGNVHPGILRLAMARRQAQMGGAKET